jgi:hypothetical protein
MARRIGEILVEAGLLDIGQLTVALREQTRWGGQLGRILLDQNIVEEDALVAALSRQFGVPAVDLRQVEVGDEELDLVDEDFAVEHNLVPLRRMGNELHVAMSNPMSSGVLEELSLRTQLEIRPYVAGPKAMEEALARHYGRGAGALDLTLGSAGSGSQGDPDDLPSEASGTILTAGERSSPTQGTQRRRRSPSASPPARGDAAPATAAGVVEQLRREVAALQNRVVRLEALLERDEEVLRKLLALLVDKGFATRDEIVSRLK